MAKPTKPADDDKAGRQPEPEAPRPDPG